MAVIRTTLTGIEALSASERAIAARPMLWAWDACGGAAGGRLETVGAILADTFTGGMQGLSTSPGGTLLVSQIGTFSNDA